MPNNLIHRNYHTKLQKIIVDAALGSVAIR